MAKILIIEDDPSVAEMLRDVLTEDGWEVLIERDGEWGLRTFKDQKPDVVLLDLIIPKLQGFKLLPKIREVPDGDIVPVFVMSGAFRSPQYRQKMKVEHGILEFFDKPLDVDHLKGVLAETRDGTLPARAKAVRAAPPPTPPPPVGLPPAPDKGTIETLPFARLLGQVFQARASGALMLRRNVVKKIFYFKDGIAVYAKSNLVSECLGQVMVTERLITEEECKASLKAKELEPDKMQGEILMDMGSISLHNLEFALELQLQNRLFEVFAWLEGQYHFHSKDDTEGPQVALSMGPAALIYEGASRAMSTDRIRRDLTAVTHRKLMATRDATFRYQVLQLDARAEPLIERLDGRHTIDQLLLASGLDEHSAALVIYALVCAGLVKAAPDLEELSEETDLDLEKSDLDHIAALANIPELLSASKVYEPTADSVPPAPPLDESRLMTQTQDSVDGPSSTWSLADEDSLLTNKVFADDPEEDFSSEPSDVFASVDLPPSLPEDEAAEPSDLKVTDSVLDGSWEASASMDPPPSDTPPLTSDSVLPPPPPASDIELRPPSVVSGPSEVMLSDDLRAQVRARLDAAALIPAVPSELPRPATRPPPPLPVDDEAEEAEAVLAEAVARVEAQDHYERLGVDPLGTPEDIEQAFLDKKTAWDPAHLKPPPTTHQMRSLAERRFVLMRRAYETLRHPSARARYDRSIGRDGEPRYAELWTADLSYQEGQAALEAEDWEKAQAAFEKALELCPEEALYIAHLAYARFKASGDDPEVGETALGQLDEAIEVQSGLEMIYVFQGRILRTLERNEPAFEAFERAARCNPDSPEALDALRELAPPAKKGGLLSRLTLS